MKILKEMMDAPDDKRRKIDQDDTDESINARRSKPIFAMIKVRDCLISVSTFENAIKKSPFLLPLLVWNEL